MFSPFQMSFPITHNLSEIKLVTGITKVRAGKHDRDDFTSLYDLKVR